MAPRLKTFVTSNGLTDFIVATTSKTKALEAWGVGQDLFKAGQAREVDDPELKKAAEETPGKVLQRAALSRAEIAKLKPPPRPVKTSKAGTPAKPAPAPEPPKPSRAALKRVADAEAAIEAQHARHRQEQADLEAERLRLEARGERLEASHRSRLQELEARLRSARAALLK
jgi:hypothetical protein